MSCHGLHVKQLLKYCTTLAGLYFVVVIVKGAIYSEL